MFIKSIVIFLIDCKQSWARLLSERRNLSVGCMNSFDMILFIASIFFNHIFFILFFLAYYIVGRKQKANINKKELRMNCNVYEH